MRTDVQTGGRIYTRTVVGATVARVLSEILNKD